MSWYSAKKTTAMSHRASPLEISKCFHDERNLLFRLAWLITGDEASAEQSVIAARETALHRHSPFRERLLEWAKWVTIKAATSMSRDRICGCEAMYHDLHCAHAAHLSQSFDSSTWQSALLVHIDPRAVFTELDPLARAVLVLRTTVNASIFECVLRLDVSHNAVLAANCRAMTWLSDAQSRCTSEALPVAAELVGGDASAAPGKQSGVALVMVL